MRSTKRRTAIVLVIVVAALALSGYWLNSSGRLDIPRVFAVPGISGGSGEGTFTGENHQHSQGTSTTSQAAPSGRGRHEGSREGASLNGSALPDVLSNLWFLAVTITVVVYGTRGLSFVMAQMRCLLRAGHAPSVLGEKQP
jgi:hypothetical protein